MKTERPDPNLPRGVQAFLFDAAERRRKAEDSVVRRLQEAGLREVILPVLDFADPYAGVTAEGDERVYRFLDRQGNTLSLRAISRPWPRGSSRRASARSQGPCPCSIGAMSCATKRPGSGAAASSRR